MKEWCFGAILAFEVGSKFCVVVSNRHDEWSKKFQRRKEFGDIVENLNTTEKRESSEESHGASDQAKLGFQGDLGVPLNLVVGRRVKVDVEDVQPFVLDFSHLEDIWLKELH